MSRAAARAKAAPKEPAAEGTAAKAAAYRPSKGRYPKRQYVISEHRPPAHAAHIVSPQRAETHCMHYTCTSGLFRRGTLLRWADVMRFGHRRGFPKPTEEDITKVHIFHLLRSLYMPAS